jgi:bifunctional UDP-N-acetylglucosamine pyrophosphorylase/glucosamine-1-phosphate N-acetyltransferase
MQAVIFAAGRGTRMGVLTETTPKSMLPLFGKPILEYKLESLPEEIDEVMLIVGYLGSSIRDHFGGAYADKKILYFEQENPIGGTADALWQAKDILKGKFLVMNGDDLYAKEDAEKCLSYEWAALVEERTGSFSGGKIVVDQHDHILEIQEGTHEGGGLVNAGLYVIDTRIFQYTAVPKGPGETELGLPQTIMQAAREIPITAVRATSWIQITAPEDLKNAERILEHGK